MDPSSQEQVSAYLTGRMPPEERTAFRQRLAADPALKQELDFQEAVMLAALQLETRRMPYEEEESSEAEPGERGKVRSLRPQQYLLAAAVVLLAILAAVWYSNRPTPQQLQLAMAELDLADPTGHIPEQVKGAESTARDSVYQWLRTERYGAVIEQLEGAVQVPKGDLGQASTPLAYNLGVAYLRAEGPQGNLDRAEQLLQAVALRSTDASYRDRAWQQLVFLALQRKDLSLARARVAKLADGTYTDDPALQQRAKQLLARF